MPDWFKVAPSLVVAVIAVIVSLMILASATLGRMESRIEGRLDRMESRIRADIEGVGNEVDTIGSEVSDLRQDLFYLGERIAIIEGLAAPQGGR